MSAALIAWDGEEWESHVQRLLKQRYGPDDYQEVPARHCGDFGIDGFTRTGTAFQAFAAEEPLSVEELHDKQRDKITRDIKKFVTNRTDIQRLLGPVRIGAWILVVPRHDSAPLIQHAETKASEVRALNLPYVTSDFRIGIVTDDHFAVERAQLAANGAMTIGIAPNQARVPSVEEWTSQNLVLVERLNTKAADHPRLQSPEARADFINEMLQWFLEGQDVLYTLEREYPEIHEDVLHIKREFERRLAGMTALGEQGSSTVLRDTLDDYSNRLRESLKQLKPHTSTALGREGVAEWLLRCPLRFQRG